MDAAIEALQLKLLHNLQQFPAVFLQQYS